MLDYSGEFATQIKEQARDIDVVICYRDNVDYVFLKKDNIQSLTYNAQVSKGLGGIVKQVCDIKAMYNDYTVNLTRGTAINLYYQCGNGNCKKALLYINQVKVNKAKTIITIEAVDKWTYDKMSKTMPIMKNTDLITYESAIFEQLEYDYLIDDDVVNPKLSLGYPKSGKVNETLDEIAEANNAIIDFEDFGYIYHLILDFDLPATFKVPCLENGFIEPGFDAKIHVKRFRFTSPVDSIEDTELIDFELDDDNSDQYTDVKINLFFPSSGDQKSLGTVKATVPGNVTNYNIGTIDFGNTVIPQLCVFNDRVDIVDYAIGSDSCTLKLNNSAVLAKNIEAEMYGLDIAETTLKDTDNDSNVKQISNMYIQSTAIYDTEIYKRPNCTVKTFGNPLYQIGDTIRVGEYDVLILEETLTFNGGLKATLKGVAKEHETN